MVGDDERSPHRNSHTADTGDNGRIAGRPGVTGSSRSPVVRRQICREFGGDVSTHPEPGAFFLFGPRGTCKGTWIRARLSDVLRLVREPALFRGQVLARRESDWIVVDEVQRGPRLLDDVHDALTANQSSATRCK